MVRWIRKMLQAFFPLGQTQTESGPEAQHSDLEDMLRAIAKKLKWQARFEARNTHSVLALILVGTVDQKWATDSVWLMVTCSDNPGTPVLARKIRNMRRGEYALLWPKTLGKDEFMRRLRLASLGGKEELSWLESVVKRAIVKHYLRQGNRAS